MVQKKKTVISQGRRYFTDASAGFPSVKMIPSVQPSTFNEVRTATPAKRSGNPSPLAKARANKLTDNCRKSKNRISISYKCAIDSGGETNKEEEDAGG
jgi:hypothetical protein